MNIVLTNDDGYEAPGIIAAYRALRDFGQVQVVAPLTERSACSHMITLHRPITVERVGHDELGSVYMVEGTPADCVRLAAVELIADPIDLIVSGINRGANSGVDVFYSGTIAGAREGAILGIPSIAVSQAVRAGVDIDWSAATDVAGFIIRELVTETLPSPGFWSVNLPLPIPADPHHHIHRVPVAMEPTPMRFNRIDRDDGRMVEFDYGASYWTRDVGERTDYSTIRDGAIAVSAIPLCGRF
jgi:5'-nucleotidase